MPVEWNKVTWYSKLLAAILIFGSFALGLWFGTQFEDLSLQQENSDSTSTSTPARPLQQWKTFYSEKLGVEFLYPASWYVSDINNSIVVSDLDLSVPISGTDAPVMEIERKTVQNLSIEYPYINFNTDCKLLSFAGLESVRKCVLNDDPQEWEGTERIFLPMGDNQYLVITNGLDDSISKPILNSLRLFNVINYEGSNIKEGYEAHDSDEYKKLLEATKSLNDHISSFDLPIHPQNPNILFFSTEDARAYPTIVSKIYTYNLVTKTLTELYKEQSDNNSPMGSDAGRILRTIGREGNKILILTDDIDNSPGICTSIWYGYADRIVYLDLTNPTDGLHTYLVPKEKFDQGKKEQDQCLQEEIY